MSRTKRIEKLAPAQVARWVEFRDKWLARGLLTGPCDRKAMEASADEAYRCAGLQPPHIKIWLGSPFAGAIGAHLLTAFPKNVGDQVRDQVGDQVGDQVWDQVGDQVWDQVRDQVWDQVRDQVGDQVWAQVRAQVGDQVRDQVGDQVGAQVWDQVYRCGYGLHDSNWLAFYEFFEQVCGLEACGKLRGLNLLSECGWWWPFAGAVILTERPIELHRDQRNRLHCLTGPAISYPDGFAVYASHGVRLPAEIITQRERITTKQIDDERNAEIRRVMIELYGQARYILDSGAKKISHDTSGILYRKELRDDEPIVMVRVLNSTPEPDGVMSRDEAIAAFGDAAGYAKLATADSRFKEYSIRVPPNMRTAKEAVAWTFGMQSEQYEPAFES